MMSWTYADAEFFGQFSQGVCSISFISIKLAEYAIQFNVPRVPNSFDHNFGIENGGRIADSRSNWMNRIK